MKQHYLPCKACPYRRGSLKGYLGDHSGRPEEFINSRWDGFEKHECHKMVDYDAEDVEEQVKKAPVCAGFAKMCKNSAKLPLNAENAAVVNRIRRDHINVFSNKQEFIKYHTLD